MSRRLEHVPTLRNAFGAAARWLATIAAVAIVAAVAATAARADGDPASDVLYSQRLFLPYDVTFPTTLQQQLRQLLAESAHSGLQLRVAVIASAYDLGSVGALWGKPQLYARFLGTEISFVYHGRLLIVTPKGLGLYHAGRPVATERRALTKVTITPGGRGLAQTAISAVRRLAASTGHPLVLPNPEPVGQIAAPAGPASHAWRDGLAVAVGLLLMALVWTISLRLERPWTTHAERRTAPSRPRLATRWLLTVGPLSRTVARSSVRARRAWLLWALLALVGCLALAADIALAITQRRVVRPTVAGARTDAPDATWAAGARRAPAFRLTDQHGRPVSLRITRGRVTILTFVDPLCRDYCPLEAHVLNEMTGELPAGERPAIIAVSVNPAADTGADLRLDQSKWHLVPGWRWAIGTPTELARIWRAYGITVQVVQQRTAGVTIRKLIHTEGAYLIDRHGFERALFLWPFSVRRVAYSIRQVEQGASPR